MDFLRNHFYVCTFVSQTSPSSLFGANPPKSDDGATVNYVLYTKGFWASGLGQVRRLTIATAAITLACLFVEMLCYVLGRLHSSCVLNTRIVFQRIEVINKTLVTDAFPKKNWIFYLFMFKFISSEKFSFQSYKNKNL